MYCPFCGSEVVSNVRKPRKRVDGGWIRSKWKCRKEHVFSTFWLEGFGVEDSLKMLEDDEEDK